MKFRISKMNGLFYIEQRFKFLWWYFWSSLEKQEGLPIVFEKLKEAESWITKNSDQTEILIEYHT